MHLHTYIYYAAVLSVEYASGIRSVWEAAQIQMITNFKLEKWAWESSFYFSNQIPGRRRRNANVMLVRLQTCAPYTEMDAIKKRNTEIVMRNFYLTSLQTASLIAGAAS